MTTIDLICKLADDFLEESIPLTTRSPISDFSTRIQPDIEVVDPLTKEQVSAKSNFNKQKEKVLFQALTRIENIAHASSKMVEIGDRDKIFRSVKGYGIAKNVEIMSDCLDLIKNIAGLE